MLSLTLYYIGRTQHTHTHACCRNQTNELVVWELFSIPNGKTKNNDKSDDDDEDEDNNNEDDVLYSNVDGWVTNDNDLNSATTPTTTDDEAVVK